jgi:acetyl esterase/lipase
MTGPRIRVATSIAPVDTSTSTVVKPAVDRQIRVKGGVVADYPDVVYAGPDLRLDLLVPPGPGRKPLVVYLPGGGFLTANKENGRQLRTFLAESGFAVASVHYRTVPEGAVYTDGIADVHAAVKHLRDNADTYGIDGDRVALWGESAGGYLAAMAALDRGLAISAVVNKFGAVDFAAIADDFDAETRAGQGRPGHPLALYLHGPGSTKTLLDPVPDANPLNHITPDAPPFQIWHGSADGIISPSQTLRLHNALRDKGVDSTRYVLDGAGHGDLAVLLGDPAGALPWSTEEVVGLSVDFLRRVMAGQPTRE